MPITIQQTLPEDDEFTRQLEKMEAKDAVSICVLRKRTQYSPLRNIISGLWSATLYRAVESRITDQKKQSRSLAVRNLATHMRTGCETTAIKTVDSKTISKFTRSGSLSWNCLLIEPGVVAVANLTYHSPKSACNEFLASLRSYQAIWMRKYRVIVRRVLEFMRRILSKTESLFEYLVDALQEVSSVIGQDLSQSSFDNGILVEACFNQSTTPHYVIDYDSPIFICVQSGDIAGAQQLFEQREATIYVVDPYHLGLLYYASYYCWRHRGRKVALNMCKMLLHLGADTCILDEIGNAPIYTMTDSALADAVADPTSQAVVEVAQLFQLTSYELLQRHQAAAGLTGLHKTLLGINSHSLTLEDLLLSLRDLGCLPETIDTSDSRGRSALAWAVEYGMIDAVQTLLKFGANACQRRVSFGIHIPLLHLAVAGPPPHLTSGIFGVVQALLVSGIEINATDNEGWSAWHVAASWRSYDILREIRKHHGDFVDVLAQTYDGANAAQLSQDNDYDDKLESYC